MAKASARSAGDADAGPSRERLSVALGELARAADRGVGDAGEELGLRRALCGLRTTLMRLVVLAYAEARALVPADEGRSLSALRDELAASARAGEALASRTGAWARVDEALRGLFDEGASGAGRVSDAAALRVLDGVLAGEDGARVRYEAFDVEPIGGAYQGLVGLELVRARGATMLALPEDAPVDLEALLAAPSAARAARLEEITGSAAGARLAAAVAGAETVDALHRALARRASPRWPGVVPRGALYLTPGEARRRAGAHYTPRALTRPLVARTLEPLLSGLDAEGILALRICDPAMGSGALLVEACRQLAERVTAVDPSLDAPAARALVAERCLYGVDRDPLAVELARASLWLVAGARGPRSFVDAHLRCGDALVGLGPADGASRAATESVARAVCGAAFHWPEELPEVFAAGGRGFDAFVGNPPWVAYAGRAAQPLAAALFDHYLRHYPSFHGYRTLHGLFIHRCASLLRAGGRLGLVVPTSVSDLGGYEPARRAHDALCAVDDELPDFGDAFEGVFQPSMGLLSTRRAAPLRGAGKSAPWRVARDDVDAAEAALLERLAALPPLPPACFGERGFQTTGDDAAKLAAVGRPAPPFVVPIREGGDLRAFRALPPRLHLDPSSLAGKLRADAAWREVRVLVRQTARFPIAALSDGVAFRNSILAGFTAGPYDAHALVAYLNAAAIRWLHFMRFRDARQGMPQVKIAHLRSIPRVPGDAPAHLAALARLGATLGTKNEGISVEEQRRLDDTVADALELSADERALVAAWAARHPAP
jgi:hypothetical protein